MNTVGAFVFKSISKRDGGSFTNEKGQVVNYDGSYIIQCDDNVNGKVIERLFKFPINNNELFKKLENLKVYSKILINFDIVLYGNGSQVKLVATDVVVQEK